MESNQIFIIIVIFFFSLIFILKGIRSIKEKKIEFRHKKYNFYEYRGWQAMAPSVVMLLIGFLPYIVVLSFLISELFNNENIFPILVLSLIPISWLVMFYLISKEK